MARSIKAARTVGEAPKPTSAGASVTYSTKLCRACASQIPIAASLCKECDTHQGGWRSWLHVSQTTLALLVALLSVATAALPPLVNQVWGNRSDIQATFWRLGGGRATITVSNLGDRPGFIDSASLNVRQDDGGGPKTVGLSLFLEGDDKVEPDELDRVSFLMNPDMQMDLALPSFEARTSDTCTIEFAIRQFDGRVETMVHELDCYVGFMGLAPVVREEIAESWRASLAP